MLNIARIGATAILAIGLCTALAPSARAQDDTQLPTKNVTVSLSNSPVRVALDALFKSVGLNYTIDPSITQSVTVNLKDVPFEVALHAILRSTNPPLQYTVDSGIYRITQQGSDQSTTATPSIPAGPGQAPGFQAADQSDDTDQGTASTGTDQTQVVVLYLKYINGRLLNTVVGPVVDIPPALYTTGSSGTGAGGTTGGAGGVGGIGGGMTGGGGFGGGAGGFGGGSSYGGGGGGSSFGGGFGGGGGNTVF